MKKEHHKDCILLMSYFSQCSSLSLLIPQRNLLIDFVFVLFLLLLFSNVEYISVHSFMYYVHTQTNPTPPPRYHSYILNCIVHKINFYCYMYIF